MTAKHLRKNELERLIRERQLEEIFIDYLNWDGVRGQGDVPLDMGEDVFAVRVIAQKRDFAICFCDMGENFDMSKSERKKFSRKLSRIHYEHLLIAVGDGRQRWSVAIRPQNRPLRLAEVEWHEGRDIQSLLEKLDGLIFSISDENLLDGITDVVDHVHGAFVVNTEKVTKRFYGKFKDELSAFAEFVQGISAQLSREWYAALMLNRLMFIYFIQKKGFLDGNINYLRDRLRKTKEEYGKDKFHSHFYRDFLRHLFHEGLDTPPDERTDEMNKLLGKVPYLNGGLFDTHSIERENEITIPDEAFERLFDFFDEYHWHLDDRPAASGRDINPDVIGYIFEKYINDRAAMGAYYTQEDITGYIARNTIIPFLLRRVQREKKCAAAFGMIWQLLRNTPDDYIYPAVRHGCDLSNEQLPDYIRDGLDTNAPGLLDRRHRWNEPADPRFALPTETWREAIARRERCFALRDKIIAGEICEIDDLITNNLDIQRFAEDALSDCEDAEFIQAFFIAIVGRQRIFREDGNAKEKRGISVLDPACGSGAFLFAALRVLEPLYERCVECMGDFVAQDNRRLENEKKGQPCHLFFRAVLGKIKEHPNDRYWIYKTIILHNLFGVDIMPEATEIAKLRLFLKLAAEAEYEPNKDNLGLEPLPDIDYNIRAGNALAGFASMEDFMTKMEKGKLDLSDGLLKKVGDSAKDVSRVHERFLQAQDGYPAEYVTAKQDLGNELDALSNTLDEYIIRYYGKSSEINRSITQKEIGRPFHWLANFYDIVEKNGGFNVIIGNPPYVERKKVENQPIMHDYLTAECKNLFANFMERNSSLLASEGSSSMIVPLSGFSTSKKFLSTDFVIGRNQSFWLSAYGIRPAQLFLEAEQRLAIYVQSPGSGSIMTTNYLLWNAESRESLFPTMTQYYPTTNNFPIKKTIARIGNKLASEIMAKILADPTTLAKSKGDAETICSAIL